MNFKKQGEQVFKQKVLRAIRIMNTAPWLGGMEIDNIWRSVDKLMEEPKGKDYAPAKD